MHLNLGRSQSQSVKPTPIKVIRKVQRIYYFLMCFIDFFQMNFFKN